MTDEELELRLSALRNMRVGLLTSKAKYVERATRQMFAGAYWDAIQTMTSARIEQAKAETIRQTLEIFGVENA